MNKAILVAVIAFCGTATSAVANPADMRLGSFHGIWCNNSADFDLTSNDGWEFNGTIRISNTGQLDQVWIKQYADNSLRIIRYLGGSESGSVQEVKTFPPQMRSTDDGQVYARFVGAGGGGPGCQNAQVTLNLR